MWRATTGAPSAGRRARYVSTVRMHRAFHVSSTVNTALRACLATKDLIDKVAFALYVKEKALPLYEQVFDIEYPLPKLDTLVAHDFDAGQPCVVVSPLPSC